MKKIIFIMFFLLFLFPKTVFGLSSEYEDILYNLVGEEIVEDKINVYFFYGDGCPHCAKEEVFLDSLEDKYGDSIQVFRYETWKDSHNTNMMFSAKKILGISENKSVPFTVIGTEYNLGFNDYVGEKIESQIASYLEIEEFESIVDEDKIDIPILGKINKKDTSIVLIAIVLGFVDGFNPCAMWILLFLINMLIGMKDRRKMLLFGLVFLFVSGFVYFLAMLGINTFLSYISIPVIRSIIGIIAVVIGIYNVRKFIINRKSDNGCHVVDSKKRSKIFNKIKKFTSEKNLFLALFGVVLLAVSVNTIELACSTVFPATFAEILVVNEISGVASIIYLIIYTLFYMIDDMVVFIIAVATLTISATSAKYGKYTSLVGGVIMFIVGLLLIVKPEWIMFNF